jgi:pimeloyl-ACP methyl ester carboxylesterase
VAKSLSAGTVPGTSSKNIDVNEESGQPLPFEVVRELPGGTLTLAGEAAGTGRPIVLLHGLSATRRNVVQGSRSLLRHGYRLIGYDARGHGESSPPPEPDAYEYSDLVGDLEAVLEHLALEDRPVLAGSSMGAATAMTYALEHPDRVAALVQITPAYGGVPRTDGLEEHQWQRFADVLETGGIDGFVEIAQPGDIPDKWRETARQATRQRLERHRDLGAVAHALRVVPRSTAFLGMEALEQLELPTLLVASRDAADRMHPFAVAREYADRLPNAELVVEDEGASPIAWQGARLSRAIADFLDRVELGGQA